MTASGPKRCHGGVGAGVLAVVAGLGLGGSGLPSAPAQAGESPRSAVRLSVGGRELSVPIQTMKDRRFHGVVRQAYDFSCGSAAAATLLTEHYERPTSEEQAFTAMFAVGDRTAIEQRGFSLLDIKMYLASLGLTADGFRIGIDDVAAIGLPAITLINLNGYRHFVVVKGVNAESVLVGDPAAGLKAYPRDHFEAMWDKIAFFIRDDTEQAKQNFNRPDAWAIRPAGPRAAGIDRSGLATWSLMLPGLNEF